MKNLVVLSGLIAAASTGCIISSSDSNPHVGASWQIKSFASGQEIGCPPGFDTAALYNQPLDINDQPVGQPIIDLFDCVKGAGRSAPLPATAYETWVEITNHNNTQSYAKSVPAIVDITNQDLTYNADIFDDAGYFGVAWNLVGKNSGAPLTCDQAGVTGASSGVGMVVTVTGTMSMDENQFPCDDHQGVSKAYAEGSYTVTVDAFTAAGGVSDTSQKDNQTIAGPNKVTNLGTVNIPILNM